MQKQIQLNISSTVQQEIIGILVTDIQKFCDLGFTYLKKYTYIL